MLNTRNIRSRRKRSCICCSPKATVFLLTCNQCKKRFESKSTEIITDKAKYLVKFYCRKCMDVNPELKIVYREKTMSENMKAKRPRRRSKCNKKAYKMKELQRNFLKSLQEKQTISQKVIECNTKRIQEILKKMLEIERNLEEIDIVIVKLLLVTRRSKMSPENSVLTTDNEGHATVICKICGIKIATNIAVQHTEMCYNRKQVLLNEDDIFSKPDDIKWNIICNKKLSQKTYCKKPRIFCSLHNKDSRSNGEVCGYPLIIDSSESFCGNLAKNCSVHFDWESSFRAQLDMEKLNLVLELAELEKLRN